MPVHEVFVHHFRLPRRGRGNGTFLILLCFCITKDLKRSLQALGAGGDPAGDAVIFFHPDYTVGTGITPVQLALADFTAGRELRPALKIHIDYGIYDTCFHIACQAFCNLLYYIIIILY